MARFAIKQQNTVIKGPPRIRTCLNVMGKETLNILFNHRSDFEIQEQMRIVAVITLTQNHRRTNSHSNKVWTQWLWRRKYSRLQISGNPVLRCCSKKLCSLQLQWPNLKWDLCPKMKTPNGYIWRTSFVEGRSEWTQGLNSYINWRKLLNNHLTWLGHLSTNSNLN